MRREMLYKVGDRIQLGDEECMRHSNLPENFAGMIIEICDVTSCKYHFYADHDTFPSARWYVFHEDCEPYFEMPDRYDLMEFITGE